MKIFKVIAIFLGIILIVAIVKFGVPIGEKLYNEYQFEKSLTNTVFDQEIEPGAYLKAKSLEDGQIMSRQIFKLSEIPPIWNKISVNDSLLEKYKYLEKVNFSLIVYKSDSLLVSGIIAEPKQNGIFPVVIFNRGGNKKIGKTAKGKTLFSLLQVSNLVDEEYVILAPCYRENDEFGGSDINDVLNLIKTTKYVHKADPARIGMAGWSRGGMMTYLALKKSDEIKTAVVINGPTELPELIKERPAMESRVCAKLIPNYEDNKKEELEKRSVVYWADELDKDASLLILSGTNDKSVNPTQAHKIAKKLEDISYNFTLKEVETDHKFSGKSIELNNLIANWFNKNL
ncbi:alpha/beta hydrolase family protein [Christiangramia echinicola]|uniref:Prolyl oligopeptidase family protein n=1 Tax=Christiangramia echinicola TaxID=279359 RepID=A0A1H1LBX9_9FLAO|nr:prolyl oligopeptidase family serine peptidase [Christiangramia echinicola]SDR71860.1 Prolyl oligopeptidase family protein [Christiangramia echinicola]